MASSPNDIVFPVRELGNCKDQAACRAYCDRGENIVACINFAERHGLITSVEAARGRKLSTVGGGPGGCKNQHTCAAYCEEIAHIDECLNFAEREGIISEAELKEARAIARATKAGHKLPGGCASKTKCEEYCTAPARLLECLAFAEAGGLLSEEELAEAKKVAQAVAAGHRLPGNCQGKKACEAYCSEPAHIDECMEFGLAAGFISPEEAEEARRILPLLKAGQTPGKCRSREQCEAYCRDPKNVLECTEFAVKAGFIPPEEAAMLKKVLPLLQAGQTPGKCRSKEQCEAYCQDPAHRQECTEFALKAGLMSPEELRQMEEGVARMQEALEQAPPEVRACLEERLGVGVVTQIEAGTISPTIDVGEVFPQCFNEFAPPPEFPDDFRDCLVGQVGEAVVATLESGKGASPNQQMEAALRRCDEETRGGHEDRRGGLGPRQYGDDEFEDFGGGEPEEEYQHDEELDSSFDEADSFEGSGESFDESSFDEWRSTRQPHSSSLLQRLVNSRPQPKIVRLLKTLIGRDTVWGR